MSCEESVAMDLRDKRLFMQMDIEDQDKYIKNIADSIQDCKDKFEECEITHNPINLLKIMKHKQLDESKKEKISTTITANK
jgi:hypothetical protein